MPRKIPAAKNLLSQLSKKELLDLAKRKGLQGSVG